MHASPKHRGFSVLELLATVGLIGILGSISLAIITGTADTAKEVKLDSDIAALNRAIKAYRTQGGDLSAATDGHQVLSKLKTIADGPSRLKFPGFRGSFVDYRLVGVNADPVAPGPRAVWNMSEQVFELGTSGVGIEKFVNQKHATADAGVEETRGGAHAMELATQSGWVWDFVDAPIVSAALTNPISIVKAEVDPGITYHSPRQLDVPIFSVRGGPFGPSDFARLTTTFSNPPSNPIGTPIRYSVNDRAWRIFDGTPIRITPNAKIVAYALSTDTSAYYSSYTSSQVYQLVVHNFAGQTAGEFYGASGPNPETMVTDYVTNGYDGAFEWGQGTNGYTTGSTLAFTANSFSDVAADSLFRLGTLEYFNSTIKLASQATSVWFDITLNLSTPGLIETFNYQFTLENTQNLEGNTADQNADYVRIDNPSNSFTTMLNGQSYDFAIQFGYLGSEGFATLDEFHVHEGSTAQADLWGMFTLSEPDPAP